MKMIKYQPDTNSIMQFVSCTMKDITNDYTAVKMLNVVISKINNESENITFIDKMKFFYDEIKEFADKYIDDESIDEYKKYNFINDLILGLIKYYIKYSNMIFIIDFYKCIMMILMQDNIFKKYIEDFEVDEENISNRIIYKKYITIRMILCNIKELQRRIESSINFYNLTSEKDDHSIFKYVNEKFNSYYEKYYNINPEISMINDMIN